MKVATVDFETLISRKLFNISHLNSERESVLHSSNHFIFCVCCWRGAARIELRMLLRHITLKFSASTTVLSLCGIQAVNTISSPCHSLYTVCCHQGTWLSIILVIAACSTFHIDAAIRYTGIIFSYHEHTCK